MAKTDTKIREENAMERIKRINYEFGVDKERPKHLEDKNIYSFEERFEKNSKNINKHKPKKVAEKPKSNGKYTMPTINMDSFDWDIWLREKMGSDYETLEEEKKRRTQVEENLMDKYLELLKAGELLPGTTFEMFQKNFYDFDTEVFTKIKKRANEKKRVEGLAALLGVNPGRIKI